MTPLEASTLVLLHGDDFADTSPSRRMLTQSYSAYPVSINTSVKKFGTGAFDLGDGVAIRGAYCQCPQPMAVPFTLEGWIYVRSNASVSRRFFGLTLVNIELLSITVGSTNKLNGNIRDFSNGLLTTINESADIALNTWIHVAFTKDQDKVIRLFSNGVLVASEGPLAWDGFTSTPDVFEFGVGRSPLTSGLASPDALVDEVRFIKGYCLYTADFTPPTAPFDDCPPVDSGSYSEPFAFTQTVPSVVTPKLQADIPSLQDLYHGGNGRIDGTVKEKGTPDMPLRRKVRLVRERDGMTIREMWSHPTTGVYSFANIDRAERYTVISYDYEFNYRAVIADNLQPDLMT